jgi:hypothetical protein
MPTAAANMPLNRADSDITHPTPWLALSFGSSHHQNSCRIRITQTPPVKPTPVDHRIQRHVRRARSSSCSAGVPATSTTRVLTCRHRRRGTVG